MMTERSIQFIAGYLFSKMDNSFFRVLMTKPEFYSDSQAIPKIWFGLRCSSDPTNDIVGEIKYQLKEALEFSMTEMYPKYETKVTRIIPEKQYIRFDYTITKKEKIKKMTITEIEKELGYKIEIINERESENY